MKRKDFIKNSGWAFPAMFMGSSLSSDLITSAKKNTKIKPISGSWFEFQHHLEEEGLYWDPALRNFTTEQWKEKIREIKEIGMDYLVLMSVAAYGKAYYPTDLAPKFEMACDDPLEAVLSAADEVGIKFFISNDYWGNVRDAEKLMDDSKVKKLRTESMEELTKRYSHHPSFYGWYFPNEIYLNPYFADLFIDYVNDCSKLARTLTPHGVNLIAPYNIVKEKSDDKFVRQLERLNIDIIAYQDGVGVNHTKLGEAGRHFENLYKAHQKASRARIWADMELFYFEDKTKGNLMPADFNTRILRQMEDISPFVDKILVYQYIGIMNKPSSKAYAGSPNSTKLYTDYKNWLVKNG
ncbi:MAG: DUF4434 domain-containing protein [Ginsengibacter sp.]